MRVLGISCFYHDAAAALLCDGRLIAASEEERFSRRKHDSRFPVRAIAFCLRRAGIVAGDIDFVVFYEKPMTKLERILTTLTATFPQSWDVFGEAMLAWLGEKLWIKEVIRKELGIDPSKILFVDHHMAHAASAFFCSPFDESAVMTVDGVGEWTTTAVGHATRDSSGTGRNAIALEKELRFPHSLGLLYSAFTAWLGFEVNEGEYKVMGMAPYGVPRFVDDVYKLVQPGGDGSFWLDMDYFSFHYSPERTYSGKFVTLFGPPRDPRSEFFTLATHPDYSGPMAPLQANQRYADVAASIQCVTEDLLILMARQLHKDTGSTKLCMAGGVALNSVANGRILKETPFEDVFIQPAAGDAGGAVGAALYAWHVVLGKSGRYVMEDVYLGEEYSDEAIHEFLKSKGIRNRSLEDPARLSDYLVDALTVGKVLSLAQGRFEWGPRALGNRSIVADPRRDEMKEIVNTKIKFREPFRPFAPAMPEEDANRYFDLPDAARQYATRFMLMVLPWRPEMGARVPAVNHMGTGRLQTVREEWNPLYYQLLRKFGQATGDPVLMNTSFNLRGEPMVSSPADAWSTFSRSGLDVLVLGSNVIEKGDL